MFLLLALPQAAEPGEENPGGGRRDACDRVRDEEAGGFVPGETRGLLVGLSWRSSRMERSLFISGFYLDLDLSWVHPWRLHSHWNSVTAFCHPGLLRRPQSVEHLSWLGLFKDLSEGTHKPSPFYHKRALHKTREECEHVREKFLQMRHVGFFFFIDDDALEPLPHVWCHPAAPCRCPRRCGSTWRHPPSITGESESKMIFCQRWEVTKVEYFVTVL